MSPSDVGIDESEEISIRPRGAMPRVIASLFFAFFAYLGLALGGGFGTLASTETNNFSAAKGGQQQPHFLTLRDTARGIVAAERNAEPKTSWHDGNTALAAPAFSVSFSNALEERLSIVGGLPLQSPETGAYLARGPPLSA